IEPYFPKNLKARSFNFYLRNSFLVHTGIVLLSLMTGKVAFDLQENLKEKNLELVQASVRVDMVAMPKHTLKELQNLSAGTEDAKKEEAPVQEETAKKPDEKSIEDESAKEESAKEAEELALLEVKKIKDEELKKKNFKEMLKKLSNKKVDSDGVAKTEKGLNGKEKSALKELVLAGNRVSKGVSIYGSGSQAEMTAFQIYIAKLPELIKPQWKLPSFLLNKGLKCRVRVWLNNDGTLRRAEIYQSSGDQEYDHRAIQAVERAAPFPKLSDEYGNRAQNGDIVLGFPL
ncbi:MAG: cell envelope integrity protein TolA, partial [Bacteriovoracaceae bacterium]|nr:cell envelope integrity protein TolA [Bacteriovoracaceae bacterium]